MIKKKVCLFHTYVYFGRPFVPAVRNTFSPPKDVVIPPRASRAIPIVAPVIPAEHSSEIKALFETFKGKPIHEQKQLLGDRLFPLVKVKLLSISFY